MTLRPVLVLLPDCPGGNLPSAVACPVPALGNGTCLGGVGDDIAATTPAADTGRVVVAGTTDHADFSLAVGG